MQNKNSTSATGEARTLIAVMRKVLPRGAVLDGSLAFVQRALKDGAKPAFVFVVEPVMTPDLEAAMALWSTDPAVTFNTAVVTDGVATFLKANGFSKQA